MTWKIIVGVFLFSCLMLLVIAQLTPSIASNSLVGFVAYFVLTLYSIRKFRRYQTPLTVTVILIVVRLVIGSYSIFLYFAESVSGLPYLLVHLSAIGSAYLYTRWQKPANMVPALLSLLFATFMFFQGWQYWIHRSQHGTFTGRVSYSLPAPFKVRDESERIITEQSFENKIVLLDFWHTRCGYCFVKFPELELAYQAYSKDPSVLILAVNKPLEEDTPKQAFEMIRQHGYSFPVVVTMDEDMSEKFGVTRFPVSFVIDREGRVVYRGDLEGAILMVGDLR